MKIEMNFSDAEIEVLISEVHSKRNILFSSVHTGVSGPKKRKLGSTLQMLLMQFNLLIEQSWKLKGKWFDMKLDCKKTHYLISTKSYTNRRRATIIIERICMR